MRSCWVLSPWIAEALMPFCSRWRDRRDAPILVFENTITCFRLRSRMMCSTTSRLSSSSTL